MCGNHFWNPFQFRRILAHELVHAFDFARAKIDTANIDHIACTEIRAANLSGECELWTKWTDYIGEDPLGELATVPYAGREARWLSRAQRNPR
ncbi:kub3-prov protein, putative [Perkinsus marinus ATCC 50983]|uniref:Mitochondrial inner membrane protease ATP23 n=1 Tax=Perkinsus marinus (strain ATCC 50983 / TXsc) TaxID=423536 RepID=C5LAZ8_PERM5|nr:kub3-prov protein, putative [Perkinsus marinus ATCC 50983]EER06092.1 kub3-prov protein, putative [Perkinsus marinus ATCC 50983]|eukprot:XP_002774276.1 kub3-prov protein, putative [Perkinsus marinus ATCC 50983]